jgi:uncharacterized protein involved in tellurium resistance
VLDLRWESSAGTTLDLDLGAVLFSASGETLDVVFFNNRKDRNGYVQLSEDDRTGESEPWIGLTSHCDILIILMLCGQADTCKARG